ncbi:MAG TPA: hypothetical protein VG125_23455, partial [Pirellulales bacterium]|nr:hypothetical protein [Pirellulales bacterium]
MSRAKSASVEPQPRKYARSPNAVGVWRLQLVLSVNQTVPANLAFVKQHSQIFGHLRGLVKIVFDVQVVG